jgi:hypothetical protein
MAAGRRSVVAGIHAESGGNDATTTIAPRPRFLDQACVTSEFVYLSTIGIHGNGHMLMLEKENLESADFLWDRLKSELR